MRRGNPTGPDRYDAAVVQSGRPGPRGPAVPRSPAAVLATVASCVGLATAAPAAQAQGWEPTQPIVIVVPAGTGGGADQMARLLQSLAAKHQLTKQPIQVVNKPGNSGAEGMLDVKQSAGDAHKLLISLSSVFTTPLATKVDFSWRDVTPVAMLALDQFVLWVNARTPYQTAGELLTAVRERPPEAFTLGGTGSKQEDQLISVLVETAAARRIRYMPLKGGGDVARALAAGEVDLTVNNPIEAEALWREGKLRPLCVFDGRRLEYTAKLAHGRSWSEIPTCMAQGIPAQYLMLRGLFAAPGVTPAQVGWYVKLLDRIAELPEWRDFMAQGAYRQTRLSGKAYVEWLEKAESFHRVLMRESRLTAAP